MLADHLRPGGHLYVAEIHPVAGCFQDVGPGGATFGEWSHSYFREEPIRVDAEWSYAGLDADFEHTKSVQYQHSLRAATSALTARDLRIEFRHEYPWSCFRTFPDMEEDEDGRWWLPDEVPVDLPLTFSLRARKE